MTASLSTKPTMCEWGSTSVGGPIQLDFVAQQLGLGCDILDLTISEILALNPECEKLAVDHVLLDLVVTPTDCTSMLHGRVSAESITHTFDRTAHLRRPWLTYSKPLRESIQAKYPARDRSAQAYVRLEDFYRELVLSMEEVISLTWLTFDMLGPNVQLGQHFAFTELRNHFHPSYFHRTPLDPVYDPMWQSLHLTREDLHRSGIGIEPPIRSPR